MLLKCLIFKTSQHLKDSTQCGIQTWSGRCQLSLAMPEIRREGDVKITCAHAVLFGDGHQSIFIGIHVPIVLGFLWWDGWPYLIYCLLTMACTGMDPLLCHYCLMGVWRWTCMNIHLGVSINGGPPNGWCISWKFPLKRGSLRPPEPSPEPCWIWLGFAPKPPRPSPEPSPEPCWTWPAFAPKPPRPFSDFSGTLLNVTWLCTGASQTFPGTFGTFSGISLNVTRRLHQCTPELFWAEKSIKLCFWGMILWPKWGKIMTKVINFLANSDLWPKWWWFMTQVINFRHGMIYDQSDGNLWPEWFPYPTKGWFGGTSILGHIHLPLCKKRCSLGCQGLAPMPISMQLAGVFICAWIPVAKNQQNHLIFNRFIFHTSSTIFDPYPLVS